MSTRVNCTVNTCSYWSNGNECSANKILVQSDQGQGSGQHLTASSDASALSMSSTPAHESKETQCRTFKQK